MSEEITPKSTSSVPQPEEKQGNAGWILVAFGVLMATLLLYGIVVR